MEKIHLSRTNKRLSSRLLQTVAILLINALFLCLFSFQTETEEVLSKMGSRGSEVRTIQTKLKNWGYFFDKVDGIYGEKTRDAVIWFQKKNGLTADGIAGPATLKAMGIYSSSSSGSSGSGSGSGGGKYSQSDYNLLARLISAEARGESYTGQVAVGAVVLNRVEHPSFPNTISGVVYQKGAFSCLDDGQFNQPVAESCYRAAQDALNGWDPSGGAIYYYNPVTATNKWIRSRPVIVKIGKHLFCS
jgi:spore cortex-lytic enzyme